MNFSDYHQLIPDCESRFSHNYTESQEQFFGTLRLPKPLKNIKFAVPLKVRELSLFAGCLELQNTAV